MEIKGKVHCFFEQSGTFKNEFIRLGIPAEDYDIQDNFGQTDHVIDLFGEIEKAYGGGQSIFDAISRDDLIMAFFPCIYFCENNRLYFNGVHHNLSKLNTMERSREIIGRECKRSDFYNICLKLFTVVDMKGLRMIVENPYSAEHYLYNNFPYKPSVIDSDRTMRGDYFKKPTQFWFVGCKNTFGWSLTGSADKKTIAGAKSSIKAGLCSEERSMISPDYARNFICDFILGKEQKGSQLSLFDM